LLHRRAAALGPQGPQRRMCDSPERFFEEVEPHNDGCVGDEPWVLETDGRETARSGEEDEDNDANVREMIQPFEEKRGFLKANGQHCATFVRLNPDAGSEALQAMPELLRELFLPQRDTKAVRQARGILKDSNLPPLLDLLGQAVIAETVMS
jgi:hypothetical protein